MAIKNLEIPKYQQRFMEAAPQVDGELIKLSFASDYSVDRGHYFETLDPAGCDLSRVRAGSCPWLWNHDRDMILGSVTGAWQSGRKLYASVRPGNNPTTATYLEDIRAGIIPQTSCSYSLDEYQQRVRADGETELFVKSWTLLEISSVAVPADPGTGVGRSIQKNTGANMPSAQRLERERIRAIDSISQKYADTVGGPVKAAELREQALESDLDEVETRSLFFEASKFGEPIQSARQPLPQCDGMRPGMAQRGAILGLGQKDIEAYSISRLISAVQSNNWQNAGLELECSRALQGKGFDGQNLIPVEALRVFNVQTSQAQAGALVGVEHHGESFIDALRAKTFAYELGAMRMDGLMGNIEVPCKTGVSSLGWVNEDVDLPESGPSFDKLTLRPRTVGAFCQLTRMLSVQSDPQVEQLILRDFAASLAREIDRTAVHGNGTTEPLGILNQPGVSSVPLGTNGGLFTWDSIVALEGKVSDLNADSGSLGYVTSTKVKSKLKTSLKSATAGAEYIWMDSPQMNGEGMLNGYRAMASSTVRTDLTKGTGTNLSAAIFGNWSDLIIATWGVLSLEMNPYANFRSGRTEARVLLFADMAVRHAASFAVATDAITA